MEFALSGNSEEYIDLHKTFLHQRAKITFNNGDNLPSNADVSRVNYYMYSLFSQVDVSLNDMLITPNENTDRIHAFSEAMLRYGEEAKKGHLTAALYISDTLNFMDDTHGDSNKGLRTRTVSQR